MNFTYHYCSPLGGITLTSDGEALTGLWFDGQKHYGSTIDGSTAEANLPVFTETVRWLDIYFSGRVPGFTASLRLLTTPFRREVCKIMLTLPYGHTMTYGEIAAIMAKQRGTAHMSAQAVGGAVGHNPISIIIPCHRVVGADRGLTGYAGGLDRKLRLLKLEKAITE